MAADIKEAYPQTRVRLVEGAGGAFEVSLDGDLIFSKLELGRHAQPGEVVALIQQLKD